jgi:hypothetical protein
MNKQISAWMAVMLAASLAACQSISQPGGRAGTVISDCEIFVQEMLDIQPVEIPVVLQTRGIKDAEAFDVNNYFGILTHVSMQEGYVLDYVYPVDFMGAFPMLYARPVDQPPYASVADIPANTGLGNFRDRLEIEDVEQGYFEYIVMDILAEQFYLVWRANYNDTQIVCHREAATAIVEEINARDIWKKMDSKQRAQVRAMKNIEPTVTLTADSAIVEVVVFTKWGGFFRRTYTISRSFPHTVEMKEENLVEYDCGLVF